MADLFISESSNLLQKCLWSCELWRVALCPCLPTPRAAAAIKVKPRTTNQSRASIFSFLCSWCTQVIFPNCAVRVCPWVSADVYKGLGWISWAFPRGHVEMNTEPLHFVPTMSSEVLNAAAWLCPRSPAQPGVALCWNLQRKPPEHAGTSPPCWNKHTEVLPSHHSHRHQGIYPHCLLNEI